MHAPRPRNVSKVASFFLIFIILVTFEGSASQISQQRCVPACRVCGSRRRTLAHAQFSTAGKSLLAVLSRRGHVFSFRTRRNDDARYRRREETGNRTNNGSVISRVSVQIPARTRNNTQQHAGRACRNFAPLVKESRKHGDAMRGQVDSSRPDILGGRHKFWALTLAGKARPACSGLCRGSAEAFPRVAAS